MSAKTSIEWTERSWNPIVGCSIVSPGCTHCYAMREAARLERMFKGTTGAPHYRGTTRIVNGNAVWTGKVEEASEKTLLEPLRTRKPTTWFVNSMGDLFHEAIEDYVIANVFGVMTCATQHIYQVLTKRHDRMRTLLSSAAFWDQVNAFSEEYAFEHSDPHARRTDDYRATSDDHDPENPPPNIWLGVSCEDQAHADERIPALLQTPAAVRFVSAEPLLGPIDLTNIKYRDGDADCQINALTAEAWVLNSDSPSAYTDENDGNTRLDWVIVGGENGPRPMHPDWPRQMREDCAGAGTPFFFKQWGSFLPVGQWLPGYGKIHGATAVKPGRMKLHYGGTPEREPSHAFAEHGVEFASTNDGRLTFRVGKKSAGRLLDGIEHNGMPRATS